MPRPAAVGPISTILSAYLLAGILPELHACLECGSWLDNPEAHQAAYFSRYRTGLFCSHCRRSAELGKTWELSIQSREIAEQMLRKPITQLTREDWRRETAADTYFRKSLLTLKSVRRVMREAVRSETEVRLAAWRDGAE